MNSIAKLSVFEIEERIEAKKSRLELYLKREEQMITDGVKAYGLGTRNLQRFDTNLKDIQSMIAKLESEIAEDEALLNGIGTRKALGVVPRDW